MARTIPCPVAPRPLRYRAGARTGVVAYPHAEALQAEDLFTLLEGALANGKAQQPDRIGLAVKP